MAKKSGDAEPSRCDWCVGDPLYQSYHDEEWGVPLFDDRLLFEFLVLEGAQAGLSWITILRKRQAYREAFDNFEAARIACYGSARIEKLLNNPGIVRNRLKVESAVSNARVFLEIQDRHGRFSDYIWQFVDHQPIEHHYRSMSRVPATSPQSERMARVLKKDGFRFVGSTICYAFMQATGMVNDHLVGCFRHDACRQLANP